MVYPYTRFFKNKRQAAYPTIPVVARARLTIANTTELPLDPYGKNAKGL